MELPGKSGIRTGARTRFGHMRQLKAQPAITAAPVLPLAQPAFKRLPSWIVIPAGCDEPINRLSGYDARRSGWPHEPQGSKCLFSLILWPGPHSGANAPILDPHKQNYWNPDSATRSDHGVRPAPLPPKSGVCHQDSRYGAPRADPRNRRPAVRSQEPRSAYGRSRGPNRSVCGQTRACPRPEA